MGSGRKQWRALLTELAERSRHAEAMGGTERLARQERRGRLNARERIRRLCDADSFREYAALGGAADPAGSEPVPADGLVGGTALVDGRPVILLAEDFTVQGGSIGHVNAAKRLRLAQLAQRERRPLLLLLDGAGERASNALGRYPYAPNDLQVLADLRGQVPVVTLVLGSSAGHGALTGIFADYIVMTEGAALFTAGPPLVKASLGLDLSAEELGGSAVHIFESGIVHELAASEDEALARARRFLSYLPSHAGAPPPDTEPPGDDSDAPIEAMLDILPANPQQPYDMHALLTRLVDPDSLLELQPAYGASLLTAFARLGGRTALVVASQPSVAAGAITAEAAEKAAHFLGVAGAFGLPVVFLADTPGVMPGPEAERAGTLRAAARMYAAQRALRAPKLHVTLRKAFGFGSSLMGMNPFDHQTLTLALPGITLGGLPAKGGAEAAGVSEAEGERMAALQSGAWAAADNGSYDRVIDPRALRSELVRGLRLRDDPRPAEAP